MSNMPEEHADVLPAEDARMEEEKEDNKVKKMPARGKMSDTKLMNLKKAREAKAAKRVNQYPKGERRDAAEERFEAKVREEAEKRAQLLAKEIREKEIMEAELAEFKAWKAGGKGKVEKTKGQEEEGDVIDPPPAKKKKAAPSSPAAKKKMPPAKPKQEKQTKAKAKRRSPISEASEDGDPEPSYLTRSSYSHPRSYTSIVDSLLD